MKLRVLLTLSMAFTNFISSVSLAQMQFGYGLYGGMQACQGIGFANGASDEDDESAELRQDRADLRREKRETEKQIRQMERDRDNLRDSITGVVRANWANVILEHMDKGMNCQVCGATRPVGTARPLPPPPPTSPPPRDTSTRVIVEEPVPEVPYTPQERPYEPAESFPVRTGEVESRPLPVPEVKPPVRRPIVIPKPPEKDEEPPKPVGRPNDNTSVARPQSRMPASEVVVSAGATIQTAAPAADGEAYVSDFGPDIGEAGGYGSDGSPTLCNPAREPYTMNAWRSICRDGGRIASNVCTNRYYQVAGGVKSGEANSCGRALDRYRRLTVELEKNQTRLAKIDEEIDKIGWQLKDIKMAERADRDLEADCPSGKCYERGSTRERKSRAPSIGQTLLQAGLALAPALIGGYVGYKTATTLGKQANEYNRETGNMAVPLSPYVATGVMSGIASGLSYPFGAGGFYGGAYGGVNGGMGCSPGIGQGTMGPMGMMSPMGMNGMYGQMGGAFGNPFAPQYPQFGGGMYMPGGGPWGMNGPWGTGQWPGGYPGAGFVGGIVGGIVGGMSGMGGYAGFPGMAGMAGMAGMGGMGGYAGFPGMAGMAGMAGMGGFAGYPGMAGISGMAGYGGFSGMGGMAGYAGYPGMSGMSGFAGFPGMSGMAGYGGLSGMAGYAGFPGMSAGMSGMAGYAGFPGMTGSFAGGQDPQLLQRQIEAQRSRLQLYQSFIQEYSSFQQRWQTYFGSGSMYGIGNDYMYTSPTGVSGGGGGTGPTTGTPTGRTR